MANKDQISPDLLEKFLSGRSDPEETQIAEQWLKDAGITVDELRNIFYVPDGVRIMLSLDPASDWDLVKKRLPRQRAVWLHKPWARVAAAIVFLLSFVSVFLLIRHTTKEETLHTISNMDSTVRQFILPDGSTISLKKGAKVVFADNFSEKRHLQMEGEIFYEVARDESEPFVVNAGECEVTVLGTSFVVDLSFNQVEVNVASGKVRVEAPGDQVVQLEAGFTATWSAGGMLVRTENVNTNYLSWKTGILTFKAAPIHIVVRDLSEYFDTPIRIIGDQNSFPVYTSRFEKPLLEDVLSEMKEVMDIDYTKMGNEIQINIKN